MTAMKIQAHPADVSLLATASATGHSWTSSLDQTQ